MGGGGRGRISHRPEICPRRRPAAMEISAGGGGGGGGERL